MIQYKVPPRKMIQIEFEDGAKCTIRNPSGADVEALTEAMEAESAKPNETRNSKIFYEYVVGLSAGTESPVTMAQLQSMDNDAFSDLLGYLNGKKKG